MATNGVTQILHNRERCSGMPEYSSVLALFISRQRQSPQFEVNKIHSVICSVYKHTHIHTYNIQDTKADDCFPPAVRTG